MENKSIKNQIISSLLWKIMERGGTQGIQFIVQIVLARLLLPEDYGLIAIISIFILIANVFIQSGFNTALIQKKDAEEIDFSSVFYLSLFIAGFIYVILFFTSPFIADFYKEPLLVPTLRVLAITLFFGAFNSIQNAFIARNMMFKKLFFSSLGAIILSGSTGVIMAYSGFGIWALVAQQLINQFSITVILWFTLRWRPKLMFSFERVKGLLSYGWKLLVSSLIDTLDRDIRSLIIGKIYNPAILGFYNRGKQFPELIVGNIDGSIQAVLFPALASEQDNKIRVKGMVRRSMTVSSFVIFPMMIGMAAASEPLIQVLLTEKWLPTVPFLQIFCITYALWPIHTANLQAISALGRSDIFLKLEIVKEIMGLTILAISIRFGIYGIAWGGLLSGVIATFINSYPNLKLLNYSYKEQLNDILPNLSISMIMGVGIYSLNSLNIAIWQTLLLQIVLGISIYLILAILFKIDSFNYIINTAKTILDMRKGVENEADKYN